MKDIILHPVTERQLDPFIKSPAQVLLISGPAGSGKLTLAKRLAETTLELSDDGFDNYSQSVVIGPEDGKSIGIESARQLERFMRLKVPGDKAYDRVAIIEDSHLMTTEAQNALLKTLEEPPAGTLIIMTVSYEPALLPTVRSRAQNLSVQRPDQQAMVKFFADRGFDSAAISQAYPLSGGLPGLMNALLEDDDHPLKKATEQARQLLSSPVFERLIIIDALSKDRILAVDTMTIMQRMARVSLQSATGRSARRWQEILETSYQTAEALRANAQPKLALTSLALQF